MKMPILSVRDKLIGFGTTFTAVNTDVAIRGFTSSVIRSIENTEFESTNPEDLSLYLVGFFDSSNGVIESKEPECLIYGHEVITNYHYKNSDVDYPLHKEV